MIAEDIRIECEENGFHLVVDGETWLIADPEQLYDRVKAAIGPWLYERDQAWQAFKTELRTGAFHCDPDESGGLEERVVAIREDGSYRVELDEDAYDPTDPKHPRFHSIHADLWDMREGK